jgi:hypothetical protein
MSVTQKNYNQVIRQATTDLTIEKSLENGLKLRDLKIKSQKQSAFIVGFALMNLAEYLNLNNQFKLEQSLEVADLMLSEFPNENVEDVLLFVKNMKLCKYGTNYNRLDGQIIFQCFKMYLNEKYQVFEKQLAAKKQAHLIDFSGLSEEQKKLNEKNFDKIQNTLNEVIAKKFIKQKTPRKNASLKELASNLRTLKKK